jgi:hypothetical protein
MRRILFAKVLILICSLTTGFRAEGVSLAYMSGRAVALEDTASIRVVNTWGVPGSVRIPADVELDNSMGIAALQFTLVFDSSLLAVDSACGASRSSHMDFGHTVWPGSTKVTMFSMSGDSILPGSGPVVEVFFAVNDSAVLGDSTPIEIGDCVLSDPRAQYIPCASENGWFYFWGDLAAPHLLSPDSGSFINDLTPTFDWDDVNGAGRYWLQLSDSDSFPSSLLEVNDSTLSSSDYDLAAGLSEIVYYWRVRAGHGIEWSNWSAVWRFEVDTMAPEIDSTTVWPDTLGFSGPFPVRTRIADTCPFHNPVIFHRTSVDTEWVCDTMISQGGGWYIDSIPEQTTSDTLIVDYYVAVEDYATNTARDPDSGSFSFVIRSPGVESNDKLPKEFVLFTEGSNPSSRGLIVKYGLPKRAIITLGLYDISGRLIKAIYSGSQEKGYHEINIGDNQLSEGVYFIRLRSSEFALTRKLIVIE